MPNYPSLDISRIQRALHEQPIGHTIQHHASVPSTMPLAHALAASAPSGMLIVTDLQTAGRGRGDRRWHTPPGQALLLSVLLKPPHLPAGLHLLPLITGIATAQAIEQTIGQAIEQSRKQTSRQAGAQNPQPQKPVMLKWPNDLVILPDDISGNISGNTAGNTTDDAADEIPAKVGGILIESVFQPEAATHTTTSSATTLPAATAYAVAGFGINVNQTASDLPPIAPPALPPTSLRLAYGRMIDRTALLIALCRQLSYWLTTPAQLSTILTEYRRRMVFLNRTIQVYPRHGAPYTAVAHDITEQGALLVTDTKGTRHTLTAADVSVRPGF